MREVWLATNRRALLFGLVIPALLLGAGIGFLILVLLTAGHWLLGLMAFLLMLAGVLLAGLLVYLIWQPRVAYQDKQLLVYLRAGAPYKVPIELVECFFYGESDSHLPQAVFNKQAARVKTSTVVVRLAESASDWQAREVHPALGQWAGGYITIRGTWCEQLTPDVMRRLNNRLREIHRARRNAETKGTTR